MIGPVPNSPTDPACLDGRRFAMVSSTDSAVDPSSPTVFRYHERDRMIWGEYDGDTVRHGRFVGSREGTLLEITFTHVLSGSGELVSGSARSEIQFAGPDRLRLVETFHTEGGVQVSVCEERP